MVHNLHGGIHVPGKAMIIADTSKEYDVGKIFMEYDRSNKATKVLEGWLEKETKVLPDTGVIYTITLPGNGGGHLYECAYIYVGDEVLQMGTSKVKPESDTTTIGGKLDSNEFINLGNVTVQHLENHRSVSGIFFEAERSCADMVKFESELNRRTGDVVFRFGHVVFRVTNDHGQSIYVEFSGKKVYFGSDYY